MSPLRELPSINSESLKLPTLYSLFSTVIVLEKKKGVSLLLLDADLHDLQHLALPQRLPRSGCWVRNCNILFDKIVLSSRYFLFGWKKTVVMDVGGEHCHWNYKCLVRFLPIINIFIFLYNKFIFKLWKLICGSDRNSGSNNLCVSLFISQFF